MKIHQLGLIFQSDQHKEKTSIHIIIFKTRLYFEILLAHLCHLLGPSTATS